MPYTLTRFQLLIYVFLLSLGVEVAAQSSNFGCPNADLTMGNFTNWVGRTGTCCPITLPTTGIVNGRHTIETGGNDAVVGALPRVPPGFSRSARLGNSGTGRQAEGLSYTFTVTPQNSLFIYNFAVVLQDPGHTPTQQPRFELRVTNQNGGIIPCTQYIVAAGAGIPGFQSQGSVRWRPWTQVGVSLLPQLGQQVTIEARTGDCSLSGHYGYGYLVADCKPLQISVDYCVGDTIASLSAPAGFAAYAWRIQGNPTVISNSQTIVINNPVPGGTTYECTITSVMGCSATLSTLLSPIVPNATFTTANQCNGTIQFTDQTTVPNSFVSQWNWNFGDGNTGSGPTPTHTYTQPGNYNVTLIAIAPAGCRDTVVLPVTVPPVINAGFTVSQNCGLTKQFTDNSTISAPGTLTAWNWNFGNGQTSTLQNPTHTYSAPGTYNVRLIVTDNSNCRDTIFQQVVVNAIPNANFTAPQTCLGSATQMTNTTNIAGNAALTHQWNFGNGQTSTQTSPSVTYAQTGSYTITLISTGPGNCRDTATQVVNVVPTPVAGFTLPPPCGLVGPLTNTSTIAAPGTIATYQWNLGNGQTSNQINPVTNYSSLGTYNITLTATSAQGCTNSITQPFTVYGTPNAQFTAPQTCHGSATQFNNQSTLQGGGQMTHQWTFGNGMISNTAAPTITYGQTGSYTVTLITTGPGNCRDTATQVVNVVPTPVAGFTLPPPCGLVGQITNTSTIPAPGNINSYQWNLGNGQTSTQINPTTNYSALGTYNVTLTATSSQGCTNTITQPFTVYGTPTAQFLAPQTCHGSPTTFTNQSSLQGGGQLTHQWNFGNGAVSTAASPVYIYPQPGNYTVTLTVTGPGGCNQTTTNPIVIPPTPVASFTLPASCGLVNTFTNTSTIGAPGQIVTNNWNMGNGQTSQAVNPTQAYTSPGTYNIQLITISNQGCRDTAVQAFTNYSIPNAAFSAPQTCFGLPFTFTDQTTIQNSTLSTWAWQFGDGQTSSLQNPVHNYATHGTYPVTLIVTGPGGCSDTATVQASVPPKPNAAFTLPPACGMIAPFTNQSTVAAPSFIQNHLWNFGDGNTSNLTQPTHTYAGNGNWNVTLQVVTDQNCRDTLVLPYVNYHWPVAAFQATNVCHQTPTPFQDQTTVTNGQVAQWNWNLGDGNNAQTAAFNHTYGSPGTYPLQLIVVSADGCADTATGQVTVHPNPVPAFTINSVCRGVNSVFLNNSTISSGAIATHSWNFGNSGVANSNFTSPNFIFPTFGTWPVTLTTTSDFGCVTQITQPATVWPRPVLGFSATPIVGCQPLLVQFTNTSTIPAGNQIVTWNWTMGDGNGSSLANPANLYQQDGQYSVTLQATSDKGCDTSITYTNYILVHPKPVADFSYDPPFPTAVSPQIRVMDLSLGAMSWQYTLSDGASYASPDFLHTFIADSGTHYITLFVSNEFGCTDTTVKVVRVSPDFTIFIPNTFTPNGDGMNETFRIHGRGIVEANLWVYTRWGDEIVHLKNLEPMMKGWDGTYNREKAKQDVYVYRAVVRDMFGEEHEFYGNVSLVR